ncbi:MAG: type II toxin-antitoxin system VapC family toxin [Thermoplasmata archaeon]|nr:type II toxin-antitoxin system VapC family toxin [Thermoplasmata archaeon]
MLEAVFIDTWGWLALGHRRDARHREVRAFYQALQEEGALCYTTDYVLDETITLLFRREVFKEVVRFIEGIFQATKEQRLTVERITSERFSSAWRLRKRFQDKPKISFTDLTSMVIMKEKGIKSILTEDEHFLQVGMGFQKVP